MRGMEMIGLQDPSLRGLACYEKSDMDPDSFADRYWGGKIRHHILTRDYEGAFHRIVLSLLGKQAFCGYDRICAGNVEGERTDLIASPACAMGLIHVLYHALFEAGQFDALGDMNIDLDAPYCPGGRVCEIMLHEEHIPYTVAAYLFAAIAEWKNNHHRLDTKN